MDYEAYYNELLGELERTITVLTTYNEIEDFFTSSTRNKVTYESYVLSSMPIGVADIVYILTTGNIAIKYDVELRNTLKNNTRLAFTKGLKKLFEAEKTKIISIFTSLVEISNDKFLKDLLNDVTNDLNKNESRLLRLKDLMRR
ncbi:hypothetical protein [Pedobacter metabolipauper]|uniref:Uncharacterized protein n=1 Tax=Pedobacter metabolipauper TaxID=425513 RepID=A0A4R6SX88_9SPHI|nr:hypothetical protein [Pedobacter metabolipauper]TDQ11134.1 hypothetical protein ATK78_0249 [Pedobacter metabolipauper]